MNSAPYRLHMTSSFVAASTSNARIVALRFLFGMACGRKNMERRMQFRTKPMQLPIVRAR